MISGRRILFTDQTAVLAGGELNLYDYLRSAPEGAEVVLFEDGPFRPLLEAHGIPVTVLPLGIIGSIRRESGVASLLRVLPVALDLRKRLQALGRDKDVVYANSQKAFLLSALSRRRNQPLIWHLHDMLVPEHFSTILRKVAVYAGNRFAARVIVNSQATAQAFIAEGGRADKVRIVYCGLDPTPFDSASEAAVAAVRAAICPPQTFLVGVFGRLAEWKGQHVLLEAVSALPGVHVAVVGDDFFGAHAYKARLMERASQPDLAGRVHFLGFRPDIPEVMRAVDMIAHVSTAPEPFGRVIVEGVLARKPVVAANAGGAAEIIQNGESGLLTVPGSVPELREAIQKISQNPMLAARIAAEGRRRAEELFLLPAMVAGVQTVIDELYQDTPTRKP